MEDTRYSVFRLSRGLCSISAFQHFSLIVFFTSQIHYSEILWFLGGGVGVGDSNLKRSLPFIALYDDISLKGKVFKFGVSIRKL